ncbi:unnamed protein product, partial [Staurois parvus]
LKHNTVQTNQTNHPQITVHTSKRRQAGRSISIGQVGTGGASGDGSGSQAQGSEQVASSVVQRVRQRDGQERAGIRAGEVSSGSDQAGSAKEQKQDAGQIQGPGQTQHQGRVCKSGH